MARSPSRPVLSARAPSERALGHAPNGASWPQRLGPLWQVLAAVVASALVALLMSTDGLWFMAVALVAGGGLLAFGFRAPAAFLLLFLVLRPVLDQFSTLSLGIPGMNVAGLMALMLILFAGVLLLRRPGLLGWPVALSFLLVLAVTGAMALLAMNDFGATVGLDPVSDTIRLTSLLAIFLLAASVFNTPDRFRRLLIAAGVSGLIPAVWALVELPTLEATAYTYSVARVSGPFVGPNVLGLFLALTSLLLIGMPKDWMRLRWRLLALLPQLIAIVPTYSRAGWIVLVLGVAVLEYRQRRGLVIGMVVATVAVVMLVPSVNARILPSSAPQQQDAETYLSFQWRFDNWRTLVDMWTERPVTGYGTKTTIYVNPRRLTDRQLAPDGGFEAHNSLVRILVEGGLVLLLAHLIWIWLLTSSLREMRRASWSLAPMARLIAILWLLMLIVALGTDDPMDSTTAMFILFALTGAAQGAFRRDRALDGADEAPEPRPVLGTFVPPRQLAQSRP